MTTPLSPEPTSEMIEQAVKARLGCTNRGSADWPDKFKPSERHQLRHEAREMLEAALAVAHEGDGLPGHHPGTCGTQYFIAERIVRIVENLAWHGHPIHIDMLIDLAAHVDQAGVPFARMSLRRNNNVVTDADIPF